MTFDAIAYGPDEHLLLTFDGSTLLAHDAQTEGPKWNLTFAESLVAVLYVDADTFPAAQSASPWRSSATMRWVVAVDAAGGVHVVDGTSGQSVTTLGPFGRPTSVAAGAGGRFALGTADRVHIWRNGERSEIPDRPSALAFSNDGATLAVGAGDGGLRFLSIGSGVAPLETFCAVVHGGVSDVVQHPTGAWIVAGRAGISTVTKAGPQRLASLPANVLRVRVDARGGRLAAQLADRAIAVYSWPNLQVDSRIEYIERSVRGLAFGPDNWLGVGLDHGDGNKIDLVTSSTHRTDTHPGRQHRSWMLSVRGRESVLSAKEAEDIRRMKDPMHIPAPPKGGNKAGRVGIGVVLSLGIFALRMCAISSRHSYTTPSYVPPSSYGDLGSLSSSSGSSLGVSTCDVACAKTRIGFLQIRCATDESCVSATSEALSALKSNDCRRARSAMAKITSFGVTTGTSSGADPVDPVDPVDAATLSLARSGVEEACRTGASTGAASSKHAMVIRLQGPDEIVTTEDLPRDNALTGETAGHIWTAVDGTVFVSTETTSGMQSEIYRRDPDDGEWASIGSRSSTSSVQLWGKSSHDVTFMDGDSLGHWDGSQTKEITPPSRQTFALGGAGDDLFVVGSVAATPTAGAGTAVSATRALYRRRASVVTGTAQVEQTVPGLTLDALYSGGTTVWATGSATTATNDIQVRLLQRQGAGRWTERKWWGSGKHPEDDGIDAVWIAPTNDAFVAGAGGVFRSTGGGAAFTKTQGDDALGAVRSLWGRSTTDVYAATAHGVYHFDGKTWSSTVYTHEASALSGTAKDVLVLVTSD